MRQIKYATEAEHNFSNSCFGVIVDYIHNNCNFLKNKMFTGLALCQWQYILIIIIELDIRPQEILFTMK